MFSEMYWIDKLDFKKIPLFSEKIYAVSREKLTKAWNHSQSLTRLPVSKWSDEVAWCIIYTTKYTHRRIVIMTYPRVSVCQLLDYDPLVWLTLHGNVHFFLTQSFTNQTALYWRKNETNFVYLTLIIFYISYVFHPSKMFDGAHGNYLKYQHSNRRVTKI